MPLLYGKQPATHDRRDLRWADLRPAVKGKLPQQVPQVFGHGNDFRGEGWLMLGNGPDDSVSPGFQGCGDCAWAGPAHEVMELNYNAGRKVPRFTGDAVVHEYEAYSGYNRNTGEGDNGSNVRDVLNWRRTKGIRDADDGVHKIGAFVALEPGNLQHIIEACWLFECVGIGFEVPESAEYQFAEGKPWSVTPGAAVVGGHYVPVVGRPEKGELACVTWARRQPMTDAFFKHYCDEAWAYVTPERISQVTGKSHEGFGPEQLEEYLHLV